MEKDKYFQIWVTSKKDGLMMYIKDTLEGSLEENNKLAKNYYERAKYEFLHMHEYKDNEELLKKLFNSTPVFSLQIKDKQAGTSYFIYHIKEQTNGRNI